MWVNNREKWDQKLVFEFFEINNKVSNTLENLIKKKKNEKEITE